MLRLGEGGGPVVVVHDQVGCPTYTGHLAVGLLRLIDSGSYGIHHMAAEGSCSWYEFALEIFRQAEVVTRVMASTSDMMERPAKRPANSVLISRRSAPIKLPTWQRGALGLSCAARGAGGGGLARSDRAPREGSRCSTSHSPEAPRRSTAKRSRKAKRTGRTRHEAPGRRRRRLHRLQLRATEALRASGGRRSRLRQAHLRGRPENLRDLPEARFELVEGDISDRDAVRDAISGCDAVVNFAAESHVDRSIESPVEFITTDVYGTYVMLEARPRRGDPSSPGLDG